MALARNVQKKGLGPYIEGDNKDSSIIKWLKRLRALPFLPLTLISKVDALNSLPVKRSHPAYGSCKQFIDYYKEQWTSSTMLKKLNKWLVYVNRTSNMAESWHRSLSATIRCQHPSYFVLIEKLMEEDEAVNDFLYNRVENGIPTRPLRKKDAERRDAVYREMLSFEQEIAYRAPTKKRVADYLERMSCHISTKRK